MTCQILFSVQNKKNIIDLLSAEFAPTVVKVMVPGKTAADGSQILYNYFPGNGSSRLYTESKGPNQLAHPHILSLEIMHHMTHFNPYHSQGIFSRWQMDIFLIFPRKWDLMFLMQIMCIKCQILFSRKNKKNISKCHLLNVLPRVLSIKQMKSVFLR